MVDEFLEGEIIRLYPLSFETPVVEANKWYVDHDSPAVEYVDELGAEYIYP